MTTLAGAEQSLDDDALLRIPAGNRAAGSAVARGLTEALRDHFCKPGELYPGGVFFTEVPAPDSARRTDAVFLGLTRAQGHTLDVCEVKISRADLQRELTDPAKADAWWLHCSRFWIVVPHESVLPSDGLPEGWGAMVPGRRGRRFRTVQEPSVRDPRITFDLLLELAKKMDTSRAQLTQQSIELERELRSAHQHRDRLVEASADAVISDVARLRAITQAAGVTIDSWTPSGRYVSPVEFGRAVRAVLDGQEVLGAAQNAVNGIERHLGGLDRSLAELRALAPKIAQHLEVVHQ